MKNRIIVSLLLLALIAPAAMASTQILPMDAVKEKKDAPAGADMKVTVAAASEKGKTVLLEGITVYLCYASVTEQFAATRKTGKILATKLGDYKAMVNDTGYLNGRAEEALIQKAQTDAQGACVLSGIQKGSYILFAAYHSDKAAGYWAVPVTVMGTKKVVVSLTGNNMQEIIFRDR